MAFATLSSRSRRLRHESCNDPVVGAILSGWRYDISGISPAMRGDYEEHLNGCAHCRRRQRVHRTIDALLLCATTLSVAAFLLAALVIRRLEALTHIGTVHVRLHPATVPTHIPASITLSLEAVALSGVFVSMLLWLLVATATPISSMVTDFVRERVTERREREYKHAA